MLCLLGKPFKWHETDVLAGVTRQAGFLAMNPNGRVPLLQRPDGKFLAESNAMLLHLAEKTRWLPVDEYERALVYQWLFFEQYSHEPYIAVRRFLLHFKHGQDVDEARLDMLMQRGSQALAVMEQALEEQPYFAGTRLTIADIALFAYTHIADEGGFDLEPYPGIIAWLARVRSQPGHFDMADFSP